jgi:hypothetical protein
MNPNPEAARMPDPATIVLLKATKEGIDVLDKLGVLERVLLKLKSNPDKAVAKLTQALGELTLGYTMLHNEMIELGSLSFSQEDIPETQTRLKALETGKLGTELEAVKGNCTRITNIYNRYLTGWFDRVLTKGEAKQIERLFSDLATMDGRFLRSADSLSNIAKQYAAKARRLIETGQVAQATKLTRDLDKKLVPMTRRLSNYMTRLWNLQTQLIVITRSV